MGGFGVARYVEGMRLDDLHAGEKRLQVGDDKLFEPDEILRLGRLRFGLRLRLFNCALQRN